MTKFTKFIIICFLLISCSNKKEIEECVQNRKEIMDKCYTKCTYLKSNKTGIGKCINECSVNLFGEKLPRCN